MEIFKNKQSNDSFFFLFFCVSLFEFWIYYFVELHERLDKFFANLFLYFFCSIIKPKIIYFIFPRFILVYFLECLEGGFDLIGKYFTQLYLIYLNPKRRIGFFFVILIEELIKILITYLSYFLHCLIDVMDKVPTFQNRTILRSRFIRKHFFYWNHIVK